MDDKDLTKLFSSFDPELPSDFDFISKLQHRLDVMELVKQEAAAMRRRNRKAVAIAAVAGFVMGVALTLLYPLLAGWIASIDLQFPQSSLFGYIMEYKFIGWIIMATLSVVTAMNTYDIALARLRKK